MADLRSAKAKAVERLGLPAGGTPLPSNEEVDRALAERNRIFHAAEHPALLSELRSVAVTIMRTLEIYHARLVGPVLSGTATDFSAIDLHLFSDAHEAVGVTLDAMGFEHRHLQLRHRFRPGVPEPFPGYRFRTEDFYCSATVFPEKHRRRAPLSPVDGKPMLRAGIREVEALLD